jgi:hypothetical protein
MPIDYSKYPADWHEISKRIRFERAKGCCEWCGVQNGAIGARDRHGVWHDDSDIQMMNSDYGMSLFGLEYPKTIRIVLTVAHHPDPNPMNCAEDNLHCLCQRCHNRLDAPMRARNRKRNAAKRREEETGQMRLL